MTHKPEGRHALAKPCKSNKLNAGWIKLHYINTCLNKECKVSKNIVINNGFAHTLNHTAEQIP